MPSKGARSKQGNRRSNEEVVPERPNGYSTRMQPEGHRVAIFLHSGEYDRVHEGLSIAASAVASAKSVDVFLSWFALERLAQGKLDDPQFQPPREDIVDR